MSLFFGNKECHINKKGVSIDGFVMLTEAFSGHSENILSALQKNGRFKSAIVNAKKNIQGDDIEDVIKEFIDNGEFDNVLAPILSKISTLKSYSFNEDNFNEDEIKKLGIAFQSVQDKLMTYIDNSQYKDNESIKNDDTYKGIRKGYIDFTNVNSILSKDGNEYKLYAWFNSLTSIFDLFKSDGTISDYVFFDLTLDKLSKPKNDDNGKYDNYRIEGKYLVAEWKKNAIKGLGETEISYETFFNNLGALSAFLNDELVQKVKGTTAEKLFVSTYNAKVQAIEEIKDMIEEIYGSRPNDMFTLDVLKDTETNTNPNDVISKLFNEKVITASSSTNSKDLFSVINIMSSGYSTMPLYTAFLKKIYNIE